MIPIPRSIALKARYLLPVDAPPVRDGILVLKGDRIETVAPSSPPDSLLIDLGNVALMPGFVNAHTHLEFSDLTAPLGQPGLSLPAWIRQVMQYRQQSRAESDSTAVLERGIRESIQHGTTSLAEISTRNWAAQSSLAAALDLTVFRELIAPTEDAARIAECLSAAEEHVAAGRHAAAWCPGLSPHAPYSAHRRLCEELIRNDATRSVPLAIHLAESREEIEWLRSGGGEFAELLSDLGVSSSSSESQRPLQFIESLALASRSLFIHCNYLDDEEISRLAELADKASVVYCPRTHTFFQHDAYPLSQMLDAGVRVALGTDGRCSNPDLSLLAEMRHVAAKHSELPLDRVLSLGTLAGACALGRENAVGSLAPGKLADLAVVALPDSVATEDPYELLLHHSGEVLATIHGGRLVHAANESLIRDWPDSE